jgi:hypothetical protein
MSDVKSIEQMNRETRARRQCWHCKHKREVPGNAHIRCAKPDPEMRGAEHGKANGWWYYPLLFDPVWNLTICRNYEPAEVDRDPGLR